jgi:hypothetical protein
MMLKNVVQMQEERCDVCESSNNSLRLVEGGIVHRFGNGWHDPTEMFWKIVSAALNKYTNGSKLYSPSEIAVTRAT